MELESRAITLRLRNYLFRLLYQETGIGEPVNKELLGNGVATGQRVTVAIANLIIWRTARDGGVDGRPFGRGGNEPLHRLGSVADRLEAASCRPNELAQAKPATS